MIGDHLAEINVCHIVSIKHQKVLRKEVTEMNFPYHVAKAKSTIVYLLNSVGFM
jgi:hypothetical protein